VRLSILAIALVACSKKAPPPPADFENLISADTVSVMKSKLDGFFVLLYARKLMDIQPCWNDLEKRVVAGYQMSIGNDSYFIVEGDLPREDVEKCVKVNFKIPPKVTADGDLVAFDTPGVGTVHAAWRGRYIVFGSKRLVEPALDAPPEVAAKWKPLLPTGPTEMAMTSIDRRVAPLIGDGLADWSLVIDKLTREPVFMSGKFTAHYATPADATKGHAYIKDWSSRGKWPIAIDAHPDILAAFDGFAATIGKLDPKVNGTELAMSFNSDQLGGPAFFAGVVANFEKLADKLPAK